MTAPKSEPGWYARTVLFVTDLERSLRFYVGSLGFRKDWPRGESDNPVCQISRADCEIMLCEDASRRDRSRIFVELTTEELTAFRTKLRKQAIPHTTAWWGYDSIKVDDPDGNEWLFPIEGNPT